jgi:hypothetical protein
VTIRPRQTRRARPIVDDLESRCLLSQAVAEVVDNSSYKITANFRWTPSSSWTQFTESPGQGQIFWNGYSNTLTPQVLVNTTSVAGSQTTYTLSEGYGQWSGSGTPPTSAASIYQFQNFTAGTQVIQLSYRSAPQTDLVDHPSATSSSYNYGYSVVNQPLFGTGGPSYKDVEQGVTGDCWLLAALAEVAVRDPSDIKNMFTSDGTTSENGVTVSLYSVRLYNGSGTPEYITVDNELPAGGTAFARADGVLWVALAEKAYGYGYVTTSNPGSDSYAGINSGNSNWAFQAITGKSSSSGSLNTANIASTWNSGGLIAIGSDNSPSSVDVVGNHAYAVVGYNPSSSQPFLVYNPWGSNSSGWALGTNNGQQVYGLFNASAAFLSQNFNEQYSGLGAAKTSDDVGPASDAEPGDPIPTSTVVSINVQSPPIAQRSNVTITPSNAVVTIGQPFSRKPPVQSEPGISGDGLDRRWSAL